MARRTSKPFGYSGFKGMEKIYEEYRSPMNRGLYKAYLNNPPAYRGYSNKNKSSYSPERRRPEWSEGEEKQTPETKPIEIPTTENKTEQKTEQKNLQEIYHSEMSSPHQLPIVQLGERKFFLDERLQELRDVENPHKSISFRDLDLVPDKTEQTDRYNIEKQVDVKEIFGLPKYETKIEFGQTDIINQKRPSPYDDKIESRW
ncbi:MAG: hypothetical protein QXW91_00820 [Candidatus Nitrosotenuis sp.]